MLADHLSQPVFDIETLNRQLVRTHGVLASADERLAGAILRRMLTTREELERVLGAACDYVATVLQACGSAANDEDSSERSPGVA